MSKHKCDNCKHLIKSTEWKWVCEKMHIVKIIPKLTKNCPQYESKKYNRNKAQL